jgi:hypothetical protein
VRVDPVDIQRLQQAVDQLTEMHDDSAPLNPVEVERAIRDAANYVGRSVRIVNDALDRYRAASREYDLAYAQELIDAPGAVATKRYHAEIATTQLRSERDAAEIAWQLADRLAAAASKCLTAYQSINKSITTMFGAAGHMGQGG